MAKTNPVPRSESDIYASIRAQVTAQITQLTIEQERLREVLRLMSAGERPSVPLVPDPVSEVIPKPRRRTWSAEAREAQRKRMKAHWRKQRAK